MNSIGETGARSSECAKRDARERLQSAVAAARRAVGYGHRSESAYTLAHALREASLHLDDGEVVGLIGEWEWDDFIFKYTHYEDCSNFHFFKRS